MSIQHIQINHFRNLTHVSLELFPNFNVLYGQNGSGKTSILEAIYFASSGRSFRTRSCDHLIQEATQEFSIICKVQADSHLNQIGISRTRTGEKQIRINGKEEHSHIETAKVLPLLFINTDAQQLITGGPEFRRNFANWGMFHVEPVFFSSWRILQKTLKHRNALLKKTHLRSEEIDPWNHALLQTSLSIHEKYLQYFQELLPCFKEIATLLLTKIASDIDIFYHPGWNQQQGLETVLKQSFERDKQLGFTQHGSHRMDFSIKIKSTYAKEILSRGQQKLVVYALRLAQGLLMYKRGLYCIYLIDDFIAELDKHKRSLVWQTLKDLKAQAFVTAAEYEELSGIWKETLTHMFHVEQGTVNLQLAR